MNGCKFEWLENGLYVWFFVLNVRSLNIWKMLNCSKNVLYVWFQNIEKYYYVEPLKLKFTFAISWSYLVFTQDPHLELHAIMHEFRIYAWMM